MSTLAARLAVVRRCEAGSQKANGLTPAFLKLCKWFYQLRRNSAARTELARMSMRDLRDIGITPAERDRECGRPFWH